MTWGINRPWRSLRAGSWRPSRAACRRAVGAALAGAALTAGPATAQLVPRRVPDPVPPQAEKVYRAGLAFLQSTQTAKGTWPGAYGTDPGVVGLAVVAFLARGDEPNHGPYAEAVSRGLGYVLSQQNEENGYIGDSMYNHGLATLALAEAYGAVRDPRVGPALRRAVDLILSSQARNPYGAWRYNPTSTDADTTVSGAQMVALFAARNAGLEVPERAVRNGVSYYLKMRTPEGGFGYSGPSGANMTRTAIGVLVLALDKRRVDSAGFRQSLRLLTANLEHRERSYPFYYEYYMSQALFHADVETWREWNAKNIRYLASTQAEDGSWKGGLGPAFSTSAALLSLALNYRYLPIYER